MSKPKLLDGLEIELDAKGYVTNMDKILHKLDTTIAELARITGVSAKTLYRWRDKERKATRQVLKRFNAFLELAKKDKEFFDQHVAEYRKGKDIVPLVEAKKSTDCTDIGG